MVPVWVQLVITAFATAREVFKYFNSKEDCKKDARLKVLEFNAALKTATKTGDTSEVEALFTRAVADKATNPIEEIIK